MALQQISSANLFSNPMATRALSQTMRQACIFSMANKSFWLLLKATILALAQGTALVQDKVTHSVSLRLTLPRALRLTPCVWHEICEPTIMMDAHCEKLAQLSIPVRKSLCHFEESQSLTQTIKKGKILQLTATL